MTRLQFRFKSFIFLAYASSVLSLFCFHICSPWDWSAPIVMAVSLFLSLSSVLFLNSFCLHNLPR